MLTLLMFSAKAEQPVPEFNGKKELSFGWKFIQRFADIFISILHFLTLGLFFNSPDERKTQNIEKYDTQYPTKEYKEYVKKCGKSSNIKAARTALQMQESPHATPHKQQQTSGQYVQSQKEGFESINQVLILI